MERDDKVDFEVRPGANPDQLVLVIPSTVEHRGCWRAGFRDHEFLLKKDGDGSYKAHDPGRPKVSLSFQICVESQPQRLGARRERDLHERLYACSPVTPQPDVRTLRTSDVARRDPDRSYAVWIAAHEDEARDSTRGEHRIVEGAGHWISGDRPDAVVGAFKEVVEAARASGNRPASN